MQTTHRQKESRGIYSKQTQLAYRKSIQFDGVKTYEVTTALGYQVFEDRKRKSEMQGLR